MIILAIETSCDDTAIAILEISAQGGPASGGKNWKLEILSNIVSSQVKLHAKYGGVFPSLAKREHQKNLPIVFKRALKEAGFGIFNDQFSIFKKKPKIDLIAVTNGPGLEPCLWTGINFAKDLAKKMNLPIVPTNHIEAHILANFIRSNYKLQITNYKNLLPAVCLVVSGGHTQLILAKGLGKYQILGETRDDAAGECFDKVARILGLGYPGGPAIAAAAAKLQITNHKSQIKLPRPMMAQKNYDFSFSGLKTAVLYKYQKSNISAQGGPASGGKTQKSKEYINAMCAEVQQAIIDVLLKKALKAAKDFKAKSVILGGGVTANEELRKQFKEKIEKELPNVKFFVPETKFSTDNAAMVGLAAYFNYLKNPKKKYPDIEAKANLRIDKS
ncbi:MAG: tRNA (adenosine(37)-N6)-threonylcarbamoyltransferase complex transferase subunit TsaD [Candidatus Pacebacteria bacterium]|nr:tRNA (adenosine(37)-N6)-threonylcarbamoyltransferase complex transferase subunit TsaD [Candidatus Paceibacterota bacterium]